MNKRVLCALIVALLIIMLCAPFAQAEAPLTLSVSAVSGHVGDTVTVTVTSAQVLGEAYLDSIQFDLLYDSAVLQLAGAAPDDTFLNNFTTTVNTSTAGSVRFAAASALGNNSAGGTLLEVRFKILSAGSGALTLRNISYSTRDSGYQSVTAALPEQTYASVTVLTPTAAPTTAPTTAPTAAPTTAPTAAPTTAPTAKPTTAPTAKPTVKPTATEKPDPTKKPTATPTAVPPLTMRPTGTPTATPTALPTAVPTAVPTATATQQVFVVEASTDAPSAEPEETAGNATSGLTGFILVLCGLGLAAVVVIIIITLRKK